MFMPAASASHLPAAPSLCVLLAFDEGNRLAVRRAGSRLGLAFVGPSMEVAAQRLEGHFRSHTPFA
jgi:hypothetical protein